MSMFKMYNVAELYQNSNWGGRALGSTRAGKGENKMAVEFT